MGTLAAGIKEIFATAKNTGSNIMLCSNDGTPDGHMTMANLASVLGANLMPIRSMSFNGDCNTITEYGWYRLSSATNCNDTGVYSWLLNTPHEYASDYGSQIIFPRGSCDCIIRRERSAGVWGEWKKSFFFANINEMANALGISALNNSSLFRIKSGEVQSNQTVDVDCGNGLLFVGVFSEGTLYWPFYWSTVIQIVAGAENTQYTVTKSAESNVVHITAPSNYSVSYAYIGFTR